MKRQIKRLFHFLGGIYLAIALIVTTALIVAIGTYLESQTNSHLLAAQWTYEHPFFIVLLGLFFINILFSALRRWPFKKKQIPFLMTHLGLLMIIGGTILKNRLGLQGQLSVWEGSGNQHVLLPHTYALSINQKDHFLNHSKQNLIFLDSFQPNIYHPFHFPQLKCKTIGYAPHVRERLETWIKDSKAYLAGFPSFPVQMWKPFETFPTGNSHSIKRGKESHSWSMLAIRTSEIKEALREAYLQDLTLQLTAKDQAIDTLEIPLKKALQQPFSFLSGEVSVKLVLSPLFFEEQEIPTLILDWQSEKRTFIKVLTIPLTGQEALFIKNDGVDWLDSPFNVDLKRSQSSLCLIDDEQDHTFLFAFDPYGRLHGECFNSFQLQTLFSYNQGFDGYGVQAVIPFPSFPTSREDKEKGRAYELSLQLKQAVDQNPSLAPPLRFLQQACQRTQVDFIKILMEFLTTLYAHSGFLFHSDYSLSPSLQLVLENLQWNDISEEDQQASLWVSHLLNQLESSAKEGETPLMVLERNHWPFLAELQETLQSQQNAFPLHILSQQIFSLVNYLPPLKMPYSLSASEQAHFLSAYFKIYGIDYRSLFPVQETNQEQFDYLKAYWKAQSNIEDEEEQLTMIVETRLTHRITPESPPLKLEDYRPGILLEVQEGLQKQTVALAYDPTGLGLKWPILNGNYLLSFQPKFKELPYRIRLRQARQIAYPQSPQVYSYESDVLISEKGSESIAQTLSMNHVYETWDGYRFYLAGVGTSADSGIKRIQLAVNHDPAKYFLTYPGAFLVFIGTVLLFWISPYSKK